jgi:hypothetical protein
MDALVCTNRDRCPKVIGEEFWTSGHVGEFLRSKIRRGENSQQNVPASLWLAFSRLKGLLRTNSYQRTAINEQLSTNEFRIT